MLTLEAAQPLSCPETESATSEETPSVPKVFLYYSFYNLTTLNKSRDGTSMSHRLVHTLRLVAFCSLDFSKYPHQVCRALRKIDRSTSLALDSIHLNSTTQELRANSMSDSLQAMDSLQTPLPA